jgi:hypothetical protein
MDFNQTIERLILKELLNQSVITQVSNGSAAGQTAVNSSVLDMSGFDGVCFIALLGTVTDASVLQLSAYENTASSTSSPTPVAVTGGATSAFTASTSSNSVLITDVIRPSKRYVYCTLTRTAQNAVLNNIIAIQYRARAIPVSQPASVVGSATSTPEV